MAYDIHQTDKLAIFADDMRGWASKCLPPDINCQRIRLHRREDRGRAGGALCARRAQGRGRARDGVAGRGTRYQAARSSRSTISPSASIRGCSTSARSRRWPPRGRSTRSSPIVPGSMPRPRRSSRSPSARMRARPAGRAACSANPSRAAARSAAAKRTLVAGRPDRRREGRVRLLFLRAPARSLCSISPRARARAISPRWARSTFPKAARIGATIAALIEDAAGAPRHAAIAT
jgi:hypothetical protein